MTEPLYFKGAAFRAGRVGTIGAISVPRLSGCPQGCIMRIGEGFNPVKVAGNIRGLPRLFFLKNRC